MLIGYVRTAPIDDRAVLANQIERLLEAGVDEKRIYSDKDHALGTRSGLQDCIKALRPGDTLVVTDLARLGLGVRDLVRTLLDLRAQDIRIRVLSQHESVQQEGALTDVLNLLRRVDQTVLSERTRAGLLKARDEGRKGGRRYALAPRQIRSAQKALQNTTVEIGQLCIRLGISRSTLNRYMDRNGNLKAAGYAALGQARKVSSG